VEEFSFRRNHTVTQVTESTQCSQNVKLFVQFQGCVKSFTFPDSSGLGSKVGTGMLMHLALRATDVLPGSLSLGRLRRTAIAQLSPLWCSDLSA
jgi:hypothetical protein